MCDTSPWPMSTFCTEETNHDNCGTNVADTSQHSTLVLQHCTHADQHLKSSAAAYQRRVRLAVPTTPDTDYLATEKLAISCTARLPEKRTTQKLGRSLQPHLSWTSSWVSSCPPPSPPAEATANYKKPPSFLLASSHSFLSLIPPAHRPHTLGHSIPPTRFCLPRWKQGEEAERRKTKSQKCFPNTWPTFLSARSSRIPFRCVGEFADLKYLATLGLHSTLTAAVAVQHHQVRSVSQFLSLKKLNQNVQGQVEKKNTTNTAGL